MRNSGSSVDPSGIHSILYVEDEPDDVLFMRMALARTHLPTALQVVADGLEAIDYLAGIGRFADRRSFPLPGLVLLDLNLPVKTGFEVLSWIRAQPSFQSLPVLIYSASSQERDLVQALRLGASDYIVKPSTPQDIGLILKSIYSRWLAEKIPAQPAPHSHQAQVCQLKNDAPDQ